MIDRETLNQLSHLLRPIATRVANTVVRGVVQLVDDSVKQQLVQLGGLSGETIDGAENFQPYGLSSIPLDGAEHVTIFPNGDRAHPLTIAVSDRRYRPTGGQPGEVTLHCHTGAVVIMKANGDIELHPAPGHEVLVREPGGTASELATKQDLEILRAAFGTAVIAVGGAATIGPAADVLVAALVPPPVPPTWPIGTKTLKGE